MDALTNFKGKGRPTIQQTKARGRNNIDCAYCHNSVFMPTAECWFMTPPRCPACDMRFAPTEFNDKEGGLNDDVNQIRLSYNEKLAINRKLNPVDMYWSHLTNCELAYSLK